MFNLAPFAGVAVRGQKKSIATTARVSWDFLGYGADGLIITAEGSNASDGRVRIQVNGDAEISAHNANDYPLSEAKNAFSETIYRQAPVFIPLRGLSVDKVSIYNPGGTTLDVAVTAVKLNGGLAMEGYRPVVSTQISLSDGVPQTIDWGSFADNEFGDLVTMSTNDGGGANETRVVHNGDGVPAAPDQDAAGMVAHVFSYARVPVPNGGKNIDKTDMRQDSGGSLTYYVTKWRRVA